MQSSGTNGELIQVDSGKSISLKIGNTVVSFTEEGVTGLPNALPEYSSDFDAFFGGANVYLNTANGQLRYIVGNFVYGLPTVDVSISPKQKLTFTTTSAGLTETDDVWSGPNEGGFANNGLSPTNLPAGIDGIIYFKHTDIFSQTAMIAFNINNTNPVDTYISYKAAAYVDSGNLIAWIDNGAYFTSAMLISYGTYLGVRRTGSVLDVVTSTDQKTWTSVHTLAYSSTATLYVNIAINASSNKLPNPVLLMLTEPPRTIPPFDLNLDTLVTNETDVYSSTPEIKYIVSLTTAERDALIAGAGLDPNTKYEVT